MENINELTNNDLLNELREKIKPSVYCYSGSGMLTNEYDDNVANMMTEAIIEIVKPHIKYFQGLNEGWIKLPTKEFLVNGWYVFKTKHPENGKEGMALHEVTNGLHGFAYATCCKLIQSQTK